VIGSDVAKSIAIRMLSGGTRSGGADEMQRAQWSPASEPFPEPPGKSAAGPTPAPWGGQIERKLRVECDRQTRCDTAKDRL
jgi:hypothetical protein